ncbi:hypothetical protein BGZ54_003907 [Gamsiella multidivaricata]|nr:hypothetical protein BGZ54_003907 [Gamsiella multidivaricata]
MSSLAIIIDSIYFRKLIIFNKTIGTPLSLSQIVTTHPMDWTNLSYKGSLTVTMLNNLKYNLDEKNLAQHGLHPRLFHLLLNFPVLFGNLAWIGVITAAKKVRARQYSSESRLVTAVVYSGICGILFLSAMPHQEARFLSPLILPLVISLSGRISKLGRKFWPLWLLVNGVMAIVFGLFHQAGVVPATELVQRQSLGFQDCKPVSSTRDHMLCLTSPSEQGTLHIEDGMSYTTHIIFYKTYLPPHHLFGYSLSAAQSHGVNLTISDWREKSYRDLLKDLDGTAAKLDRALLESVRESRGQQAVLFRKTGPIHYERTVLIAPATVDFSTEEFYEPRERFSRHANFDHVQVLLQHPRTSLYLNMFYI